MAILPGPRAFGPPPCYSPLVEFFSHGHPPRFFSTPLHSRPGLKFLDYNKQLPQARWFIPHPLFIPAPFFSLFSGFLAEAYLGYDISPLVFHSPVFYYFHSRRNPRNNNFSSLPLLRISLHPPPPLGPAYHDSRLFLYIHPREDLFLGNSFLAFLLCT